MGGAPSVGVPCNAAMAPRSRCRSRFPGSQTAVGGGPRLRTGGTTQVHRLRTVRLAALLVGLAMVAAACGGGDDEGGDTSGEARSRRAAPSTTPPTRSRPGSTPTPPRTTGIALSNIVINIYPSVFTSTPTSRSSSTSEFMDSAELTSEDPQTIVYKIKQNAVWSDGTPVSADDFIFWWENCNGRTRRPTASPTTGYEEIESVDGVRRRQDGHHRLQDQVRRLEVALLASTSCPPTTSRRSRAAGTPGWTRTPRRSPRPARSSSSTTPPARA